MLSADRQHLRKVIVRAHDDGKIKTSYDVKEWESSLSHQKTAEDLFDPPFLPLLEVF